MTSVTRSRRSGQTLVIFALALVPIVAMIGLVVDGGNAFVQQRRTQNGVDATAEAGTTQLARRLLGVPPVGNDAVWDQRVLDAINATASGNAVTVVGTPRYVSRDGTELGNVGAGVIPANTQGVAVGGERVFDNYFSSLIGLPRFKASAQATAITGYAETSGRGNLIPLTLPVILTQCESGGGSNKLYHPGDGQPWPFGPNNRVALPLCSNGPGNIGWIDWTPTAGGASELGDAIRDPNNPPISTPRWYYITAQGSITSTDDDMDTWEGKDIIIPIFHVQADDPATATVNESQMGTCNDEPGGTKRLLSDCPAGSVGFTGAHGWYYLVSFGTFHLEHSYIAQNHESECNDAALASTAGTGTGNQPNNCLIGYWKEPIVAGEFTVGGLTPNSEYSPLAIQLIK
jgi:hypothetical protein